MADDDKKEKDEKEGGTAAPAKAEAEPEAKAKASAGDASKKNGADTAHKAEKAEASKPEAKKAEEKPAKAEEKPVKAEEKPAKAEEKPAKAEEKPAKAADKAAKEPAKEKPEAEKKAAPAAEKSAKKAAPAKADAKAEKKPAAAKKADDHHAAAHAGHHAPNRKEYWVIFVVLFVLTVLEVGVAQMPGISHTLMAIALVSLALTKAAIVGLFYMHLKHETKILKFTVALPFAAPAVYAFVLIAEAAWRLTR